MLIDSLIIGVLIAKLRGGRVLNFLDLDIHSPWLIILALFIQLPIMFLYPKFLFVAMIVSYILLLLFLYQNKNLHGSKWVFMGIILNMVVMLANGGRMPVDMRAAQELIPEHIPSLLAGTYGKHIAMTINTSFRFLGDIFYVPAPYPHPVVFSIGDVLISIGLFILIQKVMVKSKMNHENRLEW
ncbi:MAG: DUF5317 domain-containing protein [Tepidibacillus sp.]